MKDAFSALSSNWEGFIPGVLQGLVTGIIVGIVLIVIDRARAKAEARVAARVRVRQIVDPLLLSIQRKEPKGRIPVAPLPLPGKFASILRILENSDIDQWDAEAGTEATRVMIRLRAKLRDWDNDASALHDELQERSIRENWSNLEYRCVSAYLLTGFEPGEGAAKRGTRRNVKALMPSGGDATAMLLLADRIADDRRIRQLSRKWRKARAASGRATSKAHKTLIAERNSKPPRTKLITLHFGHDTPSSASLQGDTENS